MQILKINSVKVCFVLTYISDKKKKTVPRLWKGTELQMWSFSLTQPHVDIVGWSRSGVKDNIGISSEEVS